MNAPRNCTPNSMGHILQQTAETLTAVDSTVPSIRDGQLNANAQFTLHFANGAT